MLFLVYKGTYERHIGRPATVPTWTRDLIISWSRDFDRYLGPVALTSGAGAR